MVIFYYIDTFVGSYQDTSLMLKYTFVPCHL